MLDRTTDEPHDVAFITGARLRKARKAKEMTLLQVAQKCGTTPQTLQRLETGGMTLSVEWVERICAALGCRIDDIFTADDDEMKTTRSALATMREEAELIKFRTEQFLKHITAFLDETKP